MILCVNHYGRPDSSLEICVLLTVTIFFCLSIFAIRFTQQTNYRGYLNAMDFVHFYIFHMANNFLLSDPLPWLTAFSFTGWQPWQCCEGHQIAHHSAMGAPFSLPRKTMCLATTQAGCKPGIMSCHKEHSGVSSKGRCWMGLRRGLLPPCPDVRLVHISLHTWCRHDSCLTTLPNYIFWWSQTLSPAGTGQY